MMANMPPEAMAGMSPEMVQNIPPEAMSSMSPDMMANMSPEAQEAFSEVSDGGLGALDDALNPSSPDGQEPIMGDSADALDAALSADQIQGGASVSSDDATTTGAEVVETEDDSGSTNDDSSSLA